MAEPAMARDVVTLEKAALALKNLTELKENILRMPARTKDVLMAVRREHPTATHIQSFTREVLDRLPQDR